MPRMITHMTRVLILAVSLLTVWGSSAVYASSSPVEFCVDKQGHVYIMPSAEGIAGNSFTNSATFKRGIDGVTAINTTEHNNKAGSVNYQLLAPVRSNSSSNITISTAAYGQRMAYWFFTDLPPPSAIL